MTKISFLLFLAIAKYHCDRLQENRQLSQKQKNWEKCKNRTTFKKRSFFSKKLFKNFRLSRVSEFSTNWANTHSKVIFIKYTLQIGFLFLKVTLKKPFFAFVPLLCGLHWTKNKVVTLLLIENVTIL